MKFTYFLLFFLLPLISFAQSESLIGECEIDNIEDAGIEFPIHPKIKESKDLDKDPSWNTLTSYGGCPNTCDPDSPFDCCLTQPCEPYQIPVVFTLLADDNCGNVGITLAQLDDFITKVNNYYSCMNVPFEFFKCPNWDDTGQIKMGDGSTRQVCDDDLNLFYRAPSNDQPPNDPAGDMIDDFQEAKDLNLPCVMNIYIPGDYNGFTSATNPSYISEGGVASFPNGNIASYGTAFGINGLLNTSEDCTGPNAGQVSVAIHEFGHWFGLAHTHGFVNNVQANAGVVNNHVECPDGSQCCIKGDRICDTDPDPNLFVGNVLDSNGGSTITSCVVDNGNCDRDASGCFSVCATPYPANINGETNIMSYARGSCRYEFTPCQIAKMVDALLCSRSDLSCCDPNFADTDDASNYLIDVITICAGDPVPTFNITVQSGGPNAPGLNTACIGWYETDNNLVDFTPLGTGLSFTPPTTGVGAINTSIPGTYSYYFDDDLNNYSLKACDDDIRKEVQIIVLGDPGAAEELNGGAGPLAVGCGGLISLDAVNESLSGNYDIAWYFSDTAPTNPSGATPLAGATVGTPLNLATGNLISSTSGTPLTTLDNINIDCSALEGAGGDGTYYFTPYIDYPASFTFDEDCFWGTPIEIVCNCACPTVTPVNDIQMVCAVDNGTAVTTWKNSLGADFADPNGFNGPTPGLLFSSVPIGDANFPQPETNGVYDGDNCTSEQEAFYAYYECDTDMNGVLDEYVDAGSLQITIYASPQEPNIVKDDNVCNYSVVFACPGDSEGATSVDGSTEVNGYSGNPSEAVEVVTVDGCSTTFNINKPACTNCPNINTVPNDMNTICDGDAITALSTWQTNVVNANPLDAAQDPNGWGTIEYSSVMTVDGVTPPDGLVSDGTHSGQDDCMIETYTTYAYISCDMGTVDPADDSYQLVSTFTQTVYPFPPALTQDVNTSCSIAVVDNCTSGSAVVEYSTDGGLIWTAGTNYPGSFVSGDNADFRAYILGAPDNDGDGNPDCVTTLNVEAVCFRIDLWDPCSCNNDQTANGAIDGTFSETITVIGDPDQDICVGASSMGILNPVDNANISAVLPAFVEAPPGVYTFTFSHLDAVGYELEFYNCTTDEVIFVADLNGNNITTITNTCYYPIIDFTVPNTLCTSDAPVDINAILLNDSPNGLNSFNGAFNYAGSGIVGNQFDPSIGSGIYDLTATYTSGNGVGILVDPMSAVCETSLEVTIEVTMPLDASFDCPPGNELPQCDGLFDLNPVTAGGTWSGLAALSVSNNQIDPINMALGIDYNLIYTTTDANGCVDEIECVFQVVNNCPANGGRF